MKLPREELDSTCLVQLCDYSELAMCRACFSRAPNTIDQFMIIEKLKAYPICISCLRVGSEVGFASICL
jgi:hypothetical protein